MDVVKSMKIIIADAKSLKEKHFPIEKQTPLFFNKAESLRKQLKELDRKSTRLNSSHWLRSRMPSSA